MRKQVPEILEKARVRSGVLATTPDWGLSGMFVVKAPSGAQLTIGGHTGDGPMLAVDVHSHERKVISASTGWEHVTVEADHGTPTWDEMCFVKSLFWKEEECAVEYHPPLSQYVKVSPNCLHLWRPKHATIPMPSASVALWGFERA